MLIPLKEMLEIARKERYAVGAFEFWSYDSARAVLKVAKELDVPAILQVGHYERDYMDGYENARRIAEMAVKEFDVPVALHLDHAETLEEVMKALKAGFTSVMIDGSMLSFEENVALTKHVVEAARSYGASVEAELGKLAGIEGTKSLEEEEAEQTSPEEAKRFVELTGVDALAVAIGTAHGLYKKTPKINIDRLKAISRQVDIPLVLHGGSGTPADKVEEAVVNGIAKVNICTEFIVAFGKEYTKAQQSEGFSYNVEKLFKAGREAAEDLVREKMSLLAKNRL